MRRKGDKVKNTKLSYYKPVVTNSITYSVDSIKLRLMLTSQFMNEIINDALTVQTISKRLRYKEIHHYDETYLYTYEAKYGIEDGYMRVKIRYSVNKENAICTIECNPNKCFSFDECLSDISLFMEHSIMYHVHSMDIAMDIPTHMRNIEIRKDKRSVTRYCRRLDNETVYLGKRGKVNNVKVYDKQDESGLSYDLTRVELTVGNPLGFNFIEFTKKALPQVYIYVAEEYDDEIINTSLSSTDRVLIKALRDYHDKLNLLKMLDRKKTAKIKPHVLTSTVQIDFDIEKIKEVAFCVLNDLELKNSVIVGDKYKIL